MNGFDQRPHQSAPAKVWSQLPETNQCPKLTALKKKGRPSGLQEKQRKQRRRAVAPHFCRSKKHCFTTAKPVEFTRAYTGQPHDSTTVPRHSTASSKLLMRYQSDCRREEEALVPPKNPRIVVAQKSGGTGGGRAYQGMRQGDPREPGGERKGGVLPCPVDQGEAHCQLTRG